MPEQRLQRTRDAYPDPDCLVSPAVMRIMRAVNWAGLFRPYSTARLPPAHAEEHASECYMVTDLDPCGDYQKERACRASRKRNSV